MPLEVKDLAGVSQPVTKLIEVIAAGIGVLYKPTAIRREASANAFAIRETESAKLEMEVLRNNGLIAIGQGGTKPADAPPLSFEMRANDASNFAIHKRQLNIEGIVSASVRSLPDSVSSEKVDENWSTRFFSIAGEISGDEMQELWGRILAGEVERPGSFSLRTMDVLRNLQKDEAELFRKIRNISSNLGQILRPLNIDGYSKCGLTYFDLLRLREAGLLVEPDGLSLDLNMNDEGYWTMELGNNLLVIERVDENNPKVRLPAISLTVAGRELLKLVDPEPNLEFLNFVAKEQNKLARILWGSRGMNKNEFKTLGQD